MSDAPSVLLVDAHDLFRAGLRTLLEAEGVQVVADTSSPQRAVEFVELRSVNVALVDPALRTAAGGDLISELAERAPQLPVAALTTATDDLTISAAVAAGVRGYILKDIPVPQLVTALRAIGSGGAWISPPIAARLLEFMRSGNRPQPREHTQMSERELEVLRLIATGLDNNQIAAELNISAKTVKNHVSSIFAKLDLQNRVQAAVFAVRSGIA